jgi:Universal stress protein family
MLSKTISAGSFDEFESFYHRMEKRARAQMADLVRRTAGADAAGVKPEVVFGKPAEEIVRFAAAHRADLIVLASHRMDVSGGQPDLGTVSCIRPTLSWSGVDASSATVNTCRIRESISHASTSRARTHTATHTSRWVPIVSRCFSPDAEYPMLDIDGTPEQLDHLVRGLQAALASRA